MSESPYAIKIGPPKEVSPFIRTARWGLLLLGVGYGVTRLSYLKRREAKIQQKNDVIMEKRLKEYKQSLAEQAKKSEEEFARELGITL